MSMKMKVFGVTADHAKQFWFVCLFAVVLELTQPRALSMLDNCSTTEVPTSRHCSGTVLQEECLTTGGAFAAPCPWGLETSQQQGYSTQKSFAE